MSEWTLTLKRQLPAEPQRVFEAFTRPERIAEWFGPEGFTVPSCRCEARPGGAYRIEMHSPEGSVHVLNGEFRELSPPHRLVFSFWWLEGDSPGVETLVTIELAGRDGGTELTLVQTGFATETARDMHGGGWGSSFDCLQRTLSGAPKTPQPRLRLLGDPRSSYVRSARMAFEEKGASYLLEALTPHSPEVDAVHPWGRIPVLVAGPRELFETSAILRFIDETLPGPKLMPDSPAERARAEQWISAINAYLYDAAIRRYVLHYVFPGGPDGHPDRAAIDAALPELRRQLAIFDAAYGGREWLAGEGLSLADLLLAPIVFYLGAMPEGPALLEPCPALRRGHAAIARRASFAATLPPMN